MQEIWKDIKNFEGTYQVSNLGRVKGLEREVAKNGGFSLLKEKILKLRIGSAGYYSVILYKNNKKKVFAIHLLVWDAFGDKPRDSHRLQVDHKDENKLNNHICNLQLLSNRKNVSKGKSFTKKSGLPTGVYILKTAIKKKYFSLIWFNKKSNYLGYFYTIDEASQAYQKALISNGLF